MIGIIGGILGFVTFIDTYILGFKPSFGISNSLLFKIQKEENKKSEWIESVYIKIETHNKRNKIGRIDDLAIRLYDTNSTRPQSYMFFAENIMDDLPKEKSTISNVNSNKFSPISILSKSNSKFVIEFKAQRHSHPAINLDSNLKIDLLFFQSNKGWFKINTSHLYNYSKYNNQGDSSNIIELSFLDTEIIRDKASKSIKEPQNSFYNGAGWKQFEINISKPIWLLKKYITLPIKSVSLLIEILKLSIKHAFYKKLILPLLKNSSKSLPRFTIEFIRENLREKTNQALKQCKKTICNIVNEINKTANENAKIEIIEVGNNNHFCIKRGHLEVQLYKSGDGHINIDDTQGFPKKFTYALELKEFPFNIKLWYLNNKIMSLDSACIQIIDSFILLAK